MSLHLSEKSREAAARRLADVIEQFARAGQRCPSNIALGDILDVEYPDVQYYFKAAVEFGLLRVEYRRKNLRIVEALDGSWRTAEDKVEPEAEVTRRECLRCKRWFQAPTRILRLCPYCRHDDFAGHVG